MRGGEGSRRTEVGVLCDAEFTDPVTDVEEEDDVDDQEDESDECAHPAQQRRHTKNERSSSVTPFTLARSTELLTVRRRDGGRSWRRMLRRGNLWRRGS